MLSNHQHSQSLKDAKMWDSSSTEVDSKKSAGFVGHLAAVNTRWVENLNSINRRWGKNDLQHKKNGSSEQS